MTEEAAADPGVLMLETHEGGSTTVVFSESALVEKGVIALHVVGGSVYALTSDMKLYKLDEVKGFTKPAASAPKVSALRPTKNQDRGAEVPESP